MQRHAQGLVEVLRGRPRPCRHASAKGVGEEGIMQLTMSSFDDHRWGVALGDFKNVVPADGSMQHNDSSAVAQ